MKVTGSTSAASAAGARSVRSAGAAAGGFAPIGAPGASDVSGPASVSGAHPVASLEALIALQEVGGPLERRRRAVRRAGGILDALDGLKLELLEGALTAGAIESLSRAVREQRSATEDPRLEALLDEVEIRAAVELAKIQVAKVAA